MDTTIPKAVAGQNVTVSHEAMSVNAAGQSVPAKTILCAEAPAAILALQAAAALITNPFVKGIINYIVIPAIQMLQVEFCTATPK